MKLANETSCPHCGAVTDSHIHFIFECDKFRIIRKQMLKIKSQLNIIVNQLCITKSNCLTGLVLIDARSKLSVFWLRNLDHLSVPLSRQDKTRELLAALAPVKVSSQALKMHQLLTVRNVTKFFYHCNGYVGVQSLWKQILFITQEL